MKGFLVAIGVVGMVFFGTYVTLDFWRWFVIPLGAPELKFAHAMGLRMFVDYFTTSLRPDDRPSIEILFISFFYTLSVWGIGAIVAWCM